MRSTRIAVVALLALVACQGGDDHAAPPPADAQSQKFGIGPSPGGGFVPGSGGGGGAGAAALADGVTTTASGTHLAVNETREQRRVSGVCGAGNSIQSVNADGSVNCIAAGAGTVTSVTSTALDGITVANTTTTPVLSVDPTILQQRVTGTAAAHKAITGVNQDGTVASSGFFVDTAGSTDLTVSSNSIDVNETNVQHRVTGTAAAHKAITAIAQDGTVTQSGVFVDAAGTGLSLSTSTLNVNLTPTTCSAGQAETATAAAGTATCSTFVNAAGTDLTLTGSTLAVDETLAQHRVTTACGAGTYHTAIAQNGTATCTAAIATPATCANGQGVITLDASGNATCGATAPNEYGQTHFQWIDEWMIRACGATATTVSQCGSIWSLDNGGTASQQISSGTTTRPGILQFTSGTTTTGRSMLDTGLSMVDFGAGNWSFEWVGGFETLSDAGTPTDAYSFFYGFGDNNSTAQQSNGCGFYYDSQNVVTGGANSGKAQNLECYCANNSVRTAYLLAGAGNSDESFALGTVAVAALTLPSTNILHLLVKMTGTTRAEFYTVSGTTQTKVCDINTNVPTGGATRLMGAQMKMVKSAGTNARTVDVDFTKVVVDLTSTRTP